MSVKGVAENMRMMKTKVEKEKKMKMTRKKQGGNEDDEKEDKDNYGNKISPAACEGNGCILMYLNELSDDGCLMEETCLN